MNNFWIDANLILRFLTKQPQDLAERSLRFIQRAEQGEITLQITPLVIAEVVWVLGSFYRYPRPEIAQTLIPFLGTDGLVVQELQQVIQALERMASANVDFVDAYLAEIARQARGTVASFDRDFRRLDIPWVEPE
jgi:predicted nucleic acid-binding protein